MTALTEIRFNEKTGKFEGFYKGKLVKRTQDKRYLERMLLKLSKDEQTAVAAIRNEKFGINERFAFVEKLVNMVASGVQVSAVVTGEGGLGKTYTVTKTLEAAG
jgi:hypothetical protein